MKMRQGTIVQVLIGLAGLLAIALLYLGLARSGQSNLSPLAWIVFAVATVALILAAILPIVMQRVKRQPAPAPLSAQDIRLSAAIAIVGCAFAFYGVFSGMLWLMMLGIMLAPLVFMFRGARQP